jgi:hypothetical protein
MSASKTIAPPQQEPLTIIDEPRMLLSWSFVPAMAEGLISRLSNTKVDDPHVKDLFASFAFACNIDPAMGT